METKEEIRIELEKKIEERKAIIAGKSRITPAEERAYNGMAKEILALRRKLY